MSSIAIKRCLSNPVLKAADVPYASTSTYNAGITKFNGKYVMVFRNDYGPSREDFDKFAAGQAAYPIVNINLGLAVSDDGINWEVQPEPCFSGATTSLETNRVYDPRLTVIEGRCYMCFAIDTFYGVRGGIAVTDDLENFEILSITVPDNRNMVLFPEKINGNFVRLERPFPVYGRQGGEAFDIWLSESPDAKFWGEHRLVLGAESVPYSSCKIGPAAPPVRTDAGWLTTIHAVERDDDKELYTWEKEWHKVYYAGIMLLDLDDPSKVIGFSKEPLLSPETEYELEGFRGSVIFPGGMILEDSGEVKIYYGAADSVECLATAHVDDLIKMCIK